MTMGACHPNFELARYSHVFRLTNDVLTYHVVAGRFAPGYNAADTICRCEARSASRPADAPDKIWA